MKEIQVNGKKIEIKKDYLTNGEVNYIVTTLIDIYRKEDDIEGYGFSPLSMMTNFYSLLFQICIEGYDSDDIEQYEELYGAGVHYTLLNEIRNADEAYNLLMDTINHLHSIENTVDVFLRKIIDKIPNMDNMGDISKTLQDQWQKVIGDYEKITGVSIEEDTTKSE